jgi:cardiolipin synthase
MLNVPNALTLLRFLLIPVYFFLYFSDYASGKQFAFSVLLLAGFTDLADGFIARKYNLITKIGSILDPLADKLTILSVIVSFVISGMISWQLAAPFLIRDAGMIIAAAFILHRKNKTVPANIYGKLTTLFVYVSFILIIFKIPVGKLFLNGAIIFSFITSAIYFVVFKRSNHILQTER